MENTPDQLVEYPIKDASEKRDIRTTVKLFRATSFKRATQLYYRSATMHGFQVHDAL
jgi:hypothetical protein